MKKNFTVRSQVMIYKIMNKCTEYFFNNHSFFKNSHDPINSYNSH